MTCTNDAAKDWSAVAAAWDEHVDYVESHAAPAATERLFELVAPAPGERVLELAAGPGPLAARWSQLVGPEGRVVISDIAPGMVEAARHRSADIPNVELALLDAAAIDVPDNSFDVVACRMGLMFTPEPATALAEIHRVLAPGGRLAALTWGAPEHNPWMTCVGMAAMMNGLVSGGPPTGPGGIFSLSDPTELEALAKGAGFVDVSVEEVPGMFAAGSIDEHVDRVSSLAGPLAAVFAAASAEQIAGVKKMAAQIAADYTSDDGVALPARALLLTARV